MIELIKDIIWNIGGVLSTILFFMFGMTFIFSWIVNRLSWWYKKESRENMFYWIQNKKRINEIIDAEKSDK